MHHRDRLRHNLRLLQDRQFRHQHGKNRYWLPQSVDALLDSEAKEVKPSEMTEDEDTEKSDSNYSHSELNYEYEQEHCDNKGQ